LDLVYTAPKIHLKKKKKKFPFEKFYNACARTHAFEYAVCVVRIRKGSWYIEESARDSKQVKSTHTHRRTTGGENVT